MKPSVYILRNGTDKIPDRGNCSAGDIVILTSGDILVFTGRMWQLLPGRYESIEQLKEFIGYVSSGWPDETKTARTDLSGKVSPDFLSRFLKMCDRIQTEKGSGDEPNP